MAGKTRNERISDLEEITDILKKAVLEIRTVEIAKINEVIHKGNDATKKILEAHNMLSERNFEQMKQIEFLKFLIFNKLFGSSEELIKHLTTIAENKEIPDEFVDIARNLAEEAKKSIKGKAKPWTPKIVPR